VPERSLDVRVIAVVNVGLEIQSPGGINMRFQEQLDEKYTYCTLNALGRIRTPLIRWIPRKFSADPMITMINESLLYL
jgi:hypothetical protein